VQEIVNAIVPLRGALGSDCPVLGLAPAGRCNDFARALQITTDPANIAEAISLRATADVDLGRVNERFFCTVATLGADAEVTDFVDGMKLPLTGTPAYVYGAIRVLLRYRSKPVRLHGDFGTIAKPVFVASSANTSSYGGGIPIAPGANPLDGMLDLCLIDAVSRLRSLWLLPTVFAGRHVGLPIVRFVRTAGFRLESQAPLDVWADGERIGSTPVHIAAAPGAVRVLVHQAFAVNARAGGRTLPA
jgi:diacylglycerol kinase (ATP)